jgi:hypothetical protein
MSKAPRPDANDASIQQALRAEPVRPAPRTLYQRVTQGVRIAAWRQREEARFRKSLLGWCVLLALATLGPLALAAVFNLDRVLQHGFSGGLGWFDYYVSSLVMEVLNYSGSYTLVTAVVLTLGTMLLGLLPYGRSLRGH